MGQGNRLNPTCDGEFGFLFPCCICQERERVLVATSQILFFNLDDEATGLFYIVRPKLLR